jgi:hypothetical protein
MVYGGYFERARRNSSSMVLDSTADPPAAIEALRAAATCPNGVGIAHPLAGAGALCR